MRAFNPQLSVPQQTPADRNPPLSWELVGISETGDRLPAIPVAERPIRVGRNSSNSFVLSDPTVSQNHAEIFASGPNLFLRDLNSTNGTFVNGVRISSRVKLSDGDDVAIGVFRIEIHTKQIEAASAANRGDATVLSLDGWVDNTLSDIISGEGLYVVFQPIVCLQTLEFFGFEALVRSSISGLESPAELFRLATKFRKSKHLSETCRRIAAFDAQLLPKGSKIFLNTSSDEQMNTELLVSLQMLRKSHPDQHFVIEVHEECFTEPEQLVDFHLRLRDLEIGLAFDDFGAGKSRLQDLMHIRPDYVKFDRALLQDSLLVEEKQQMWVKSLMQSVRDLDIITLAEGVESQGVVQLCQEMGFDLCQGYATGRPARVAEWVADHPVSVTR